MKGYKVTVKGVTHQHRLPFFCPHCKKISGTLDDRFFENYGFCAECFVMHVEDRSVPQIDFEKYVPDGSPLKDMPMEEILAKNLTDPDSPEFLEPKK